MRLRPSRAQDHDAVLAVLTARDQEDFREPGLTASVLTDQWRVRDFDPGRDAAVVEDESGILGYAAVFDVGDLAFVHPAREGEGVGTRLLAWAEDRARSRGTFRQRLAGGNRRGRAFLEAAGYQCERSVYCLGWNGQPALAPAPVPAGITLEPLLVDRDAPELHRLDMLAFSGNRDYREEPFEAFVDEHLSHPDLDPPSNRIARQDGRGVGFVLCRRSGDLGYIDLLAVLGEVRRRGIGRALLAHALTTLDGAGVADTRLDVASDNPRALALYRSAGMSGRHEVVVYEKPSGR
jgi:ribosomal protein S18 acetylase RimI-like enzyme